MAQKGLGVSLPGAARGADLGGSSKYSREGPGGLMRRRVPCEQLLHTGQSILSPRRTPMCDVRVVFLDTPAAGRKGIRFLFLNPDAVPFYRACLEAVPAPRFGAVETGRA